MKKCAIGLVRLYQRLLSPLFPPSCRYNPTCSNYMIQAIERHGLKGDSDGACSDSPLPSLEQDGSGSSSRSFQSEEPPRRGRERQN